MSQSTITLIIIACTCVLYLTEKFSVAVTTVLGMLALIFTGILDFNEAFACFTSTNVMLVLGMIIIVESLLDSGVAEKLGCQLFKLVGKSEKTFLLIIFISAAFFSLFSTNAALVAMYMPLISSVSAASGARSPASIPICPWLWAASSAVPALWQAALPRCWPTMCFRSPVKPCISLRLCPLQPSWWPWWRCATGSSCTTCR